MIERIGQLCGWQYAWYYGNSVISLQTDHNYLKIMQHTKKKKHFHHEILLAEMYISSTSLNQRWMELWSPNVEDLVEKYVPNAKMITKGARDPMYMRDYYKKWMHFQDNTLYVASLYGPPEGGNCQFHIYEYDSMDSFTTAKTPIYYRNIPRSEGELLFFMASEGRFD